MIIATRFRDLPDEQMKEIVDYVESGRPMIGMRTATHAFSIKGAKKYARYSYNSKEWAGGFGRQVLGETWVNHHGSHGKEGTRGLIAPGAESHPILKGIKDGDIWGADRRLHRPSPLARRQQAAGARPGCRRHEPDRQAGRREEERPDDAGGLGQDVHGRVGQARPSLHHHDGSRHRPGQRRHPADARQRRPTGPSASRTRSRARATSRSSASTTPTRSATTSSPKGSSPRTSLSNDGEWAMIDERS